MNVASSPETDPVLIPPHPEERAQGLMSNSEAPACPDLCSFPAEALVEYRAINPAKIAVKMYFLFVFITIVV
jgi:hypothetical protein